MNNFRREAKKLKFYRESNTVHPVCTCNPSFYRLKLYTFVQKEASEPRAFESHPNVSFSKLLHECDCGW
jgi:hypothetical protein